MKTTRWTVDSLLWARDMHRAQACSLLVSAFWANSDARDENGRYFLAVATRHARAAEKLGRVYQDMLIAKLRGFRIAREVAA